MYTHVWKGLAQSVLCPRGGPLAVCSEESPTEEWSGEDSEEIRWDLVTRVRGEIAAGRYETEVKWEVALDRLLARLGLGEG